MKDESIWNPIEEYIAELQKQYSPYDAFYPSCASCEVDGKIIGSWDGCLRKQFYRWKGVEPSNKIVYRSWLSARLGSAFEEAFIDAYKHKGLLKAYKQKFEVEIMGLRIKGEIDGLTKKNELIECKSAYGVSFMSERSKSPNINHFPQILTYLAVLGLNTCLLPYASRDNTSFRSAFRITKQEIEKEGIYFIKILTRWKTLKNYLDRDQEPPKDFSLKDKDYQCSYCEYLRTCYTKEEIDEYFEKLKS